MRYFFTSILTLCLFNFLSGQNLPSTDIYLFQLVEQGDTALRVTKPKFLTDFNIGGYNNQPQFISNSELLITVGLKGQTQTDIYLLNLDKSSRLRLTATPESEFSPNVTPENLFFSVVRVETDADRSQRLWQYPLDRKDKGKPVFKYLRGIGYYHWLDRFRVALFNVADVNYLSLGDTRDESTRHLAPNIGRCFQTSPSGRLVYVHKVTDNTWVIKAMDKSTLDVEEIVSTIPGAEDFVILKDGTIVMGKGSRLYSFHPRKGDAQWREFADLKNTGVTAISRMAVSADGKLAIVNGRE
jgi:hypothetical protein